MTLKRFAGLEGKTKELHQDLIDNLSPEDLKAGNFRTSAPTTSTLDKGRHAFAEINGVPTFYYRGTNGTIYKVYEGTPI